MWPWTTKPAPTKKLATKSIVLWQPSTNSSLITTSLLKKKQKRSSHHGKIYNRKSVLQKALPNITQSPVLNPWRISLLLIKWEGISRNSRGLRVLTWLICLEITKVISVWDDLFILLLLKLNFLITLFGINLFIETVKSWATKQVETFKSKIQLLNFLVAPTFNSGWEEWELEEETPEKTFFSTL